MLDEGGDPAEPLAIDGGIGPKTQAGFSRALSLAGSQTLTRRLARNLGFF